MKKTWYFLLVIIVLGDSKHASKIIFKHNEDNLNMNEWRWSAQNDTLNLKSNLTLDSYNDYYELEYASGDGRPRAKTEFELKLLDAEIVSDVIPKFPKKCLKVTYKHGDLIPGQKLKFWEAWYQPNIKFESDSDKSLHTIFLSCNSKYILLSSESLPHGFLFDTGNETMKWLVINIPGNNISAGRTLYNYTPPSIPHSNQVFDRYTFLLYEQKFKIGDHWLPKTVNGDDYRAGEILRSYSFAQEHKLGDPIAANFFVLNNYW